MKNFIKVLAVSSLPFAFFACSKKMQTFQFGNHPERGTAAISSNMTTDNFSVASTEKGNSVLELNNPAIEVAKQTNQPNKLETATTAERPTFKQRIAQKMIVKKIQKLEKAQEKGNYLKLGIVIAAVSLLVLIIVAAGLLGGLSGLFWLLGGLGLLTGLLIILLDVLDVI